MKRIIIVTIIPLVLISIVVGLLILSSNIRPNIALNYNTGFFNSDSNLKSLRIIQSNNAEFSIFSGVATFDRIASANQIASLEKTFQFNDDNNLNISTLIFIVGASPQEENDFRSEDATVRANLANRDSFFRLLKSDAFINLVSTRNYAVSDETTSWKYIFNSGASKAISDEIVKEYFTQLVEKGYSLVLDRSKIIFTNEGLVQLNVVINKTSKLITNIEIKLLQEASLDFGTPLTVLDPNYSGGLRNQNLTVKSNIGFTLNYTIKSIELKDNSKRFASAGFLDELILNRMPF